MSKLLRWNAEDFDGVDDFLDRALGEANHWANYKKTIDEQLPEWDEDCEFDRVKGLALVKRAVQYRSNIYKSREALVKVRDGAVGRELTPEEIGQVEKLEHRIAGWALEIMKLRGEFREYVEVQQLPERVRGRQPRRDTLTTEDYS